MSNKRYKRDINKIKKDFPFQIEDNQTRLIINERVSLEIEKEQLLDEMDINSIIPLPTDFYNPGIIKKDFYQLPVEIWKNQYNPIENKISEDYDLGNWQS
ncbi:MAG: hypothetical protein ACP5OG_01445 [Candidatus Nanoarchaeia archaeon]